MAIKVWTPIRFLNFAPFCICFDLPNSPHSTADFDQNSPLLVNETKIPFFKVRFARNWCKMRLFVDFQTLFAKSRIFWAKDFINRISQKNCKWWAIWWSGKSGSLPRKTPLNIRCWKWLSCAKLFCNARPSVYPYIRLILHMLSMGNARGAALLRSFRQMSAGWRKPPTEHLYL